MQHAIINAMKCMRAIKDRIARPVHQLENHLKPVNPSQLGGRHSNPVVTTPMIALDFLGMTHQSAGHNVAFNQVINQSVNRLKMYAWMPFINQYSMHTNHDSQGTAQPIEASQPSPATAITVDTPWNSNPKAHNTQRTLCQISPEIFAHQQLHALFHKSFYSL
ncbi:28 kDa ribonucleoprotein, chloroplastic [Dorcoceras hygrometricum]|uniref:28 kDa ribonucleoprotein, chloroplastic n=1 Tax=Dorcoceras hygrometricum TaxID=472368 RepID=A0A2Z7BP01_9LAMI|nr:28 kDa ribonucleoprotein, chloroplastic [Dorcoceras hygrometricum]